MLSVCVEMEDISGFSICCCGRSTLLGSAGESGGVILGVAGGLGGEDGSLVVDLSNFKDIVVDEVTNTVQVGAGNRLGDVALRLNDYGRALPHGRCTTVGYASVSSRV